jgi:LCP family protein required for cell wall assembly
MSSENVINVLLIGVDSEDGLASGGNSDAIMLASLNRVTKKITLVSVMRDSFVYMDIDGQKRFFKINAAYNWGGPATLVKIVEDNYKIAIRNYVCVDFSTFPKIIDTLGGINLDVQAYEARCVKDFFGFTIPSGENALLNGHSALAFSRIRKCDADGDISRTRRQRSVITAIITKARDASNTQLSEVLDNIFPHLRTNYRKSEIFTLGSQALLYKWADYEIEQITSPAEKNRAPTNINTYFVWVVDYPLEAQELQIALYGKTNIVLDNERISALEMLKPRTNIPKPTTSPTFVETSSIEGPTHIDGPTHIYDSSDVVDNDDTSPFEEDSNLFTTEVDADILSTRGHDQDDNLHNNEELQTNASP